MKIEICTIGGYSQVGKNCTAIKVEDDVILCDMGVYLDEYIKFTEQEDIIKLNPQDLITAGAIPNITVIKSWTKDVKAIIPTHAHLDHIGAIPFLAPRFENAEVLGTPYTTKVIETILKDEKIKIKNEIKTLSPNSIYKISDNITIEFINMTHSTPQTVMIAIHTPKGIILYANDFKFDSAPTLGKKPNFERLKELTKIGVKALIVDSTYAELESKTPSESVAKEMLKEVMLGTETSKKTVIVTTFSSHLARLKSIIEFGKKMNRKILFLGRSLSKYIYAGQDINIIDFAKDAKIIKYKGQISRELAKVAKNPDKYLLVMTGHQGEPKAMLSRLMQESFPLHLKKEDIVIFSCKTIPTKVNLQNREQLEHKLKDKGVRIFKNVHVSGHAAREDLRDLINMIKPENIIPAHGNKNMINALADLCYEMEYKKERVHIMKNGQKISFE